MNELLFIPGAPAPNQLVRAIASKLDSSELARRLVALTGAVAVNLTVLAILQSSAADARYAPPGEVVITQLDAPSELRVAQN